MTEIELIVTYLCNWSCDFCAVDTHNKPLINREDLENKLQKIDDMREENLAVTISGGEPGLLSEEIILYILDYLDILGASISLNTNGLFLEKYPNLIERFDYILYHCSESLDFSDVKMYENSKIDYMIVVNDTNFKNYTDFMDRFAETGKEIDVIPATYADGGLDKILSPKNRNRLLVSKKNYPFISEKSLKWIITERNYDEIIYI